MKKFILSIVSVFVLGNLAAAQEISITSAQAPEKIPFAKPFAVQYEISHTPGYDVEIEEGSLSPDFEITQSAFDRRSPETGLYDFTAVPFALGKSTFTVTFLLTKDGKTAAWTEKELPIEITRVQIFNDKELREIRPPKTPAGWLSWLLGILVVLALIYAIYCWRRYHTHEALRLEIQEDLRPCDEIALSKIDALIDSGLWERKEYKLFYISLCAILREYLWRQLKIDTSADTSYELLRRVKTIPVMQPLLMPLKDFLNSGDLVKFAKAEPTETVRNKDIDTLRLIVRETTPKETITEQKHV